MKIILSYVAIFFLNSTFAASEVAQTFAYQGRLFNAAGTAPSSDQVVFIFSLYAPAGNECLLYQESQSLDLALTDGFFSFKIGSFVGALGKRTTADPALSMAQIFGSRAVQIRLLGDPNCALGYTPSASGGDERRLRVSISRNAGAFSDLTPDQSLNSATQALVAQTLQGYVPADFVMRTTNITQANVEKLVDGSDVGSLHHHDGRYFAPSSSTAQDLGSAGSYTTGTFGVGLSSAPVSKVEIKGAGATSTTSSFNITNSSSASLLFVRDDGKVGLGSAAPTFDLSFGGNAARILGLERNSVAASVGNDMTLKSGGATSLGANLSGGDLYLASGISTGTGTSKMHFQTVTAGTSGTADNAPTTKMTILGNGNVGIGTTSPSNNQGWNRVLDVSGIAHSKILATEQTTGVLTGIFSNSFWGGSPAGTIGTESSHPLRLITGYSEKMRIDLAGNVGIGTPTPNRPLHVTSATAPTIILENSAGAADQKRRYMTASSSGDMAWGKFSDDMSTTTEQMRLLSSGSLGLGVVSPTAVLHLKAGTATLDTAPLKFTTGVLLTVPENGAMEYNGTDYFITSGGARRKIASTNATDDYVSVNSITGSGALTVSAGGTNQNLILAGSGTGSVTTASPMAVTSATASTSSTTGAFVTSGGVGVGGNIFSGGNISSAGIFLAPLGTAAAPSYAITGDTNTGVFSPAADNWAVSTAGSEKMRINANGNVGIGTASPTFPFSVQGTIQGRGIAYFTQAAPENSLAIDASSSSFYKIYSNAAVDIGIGTNSSTDQLYLKSGGNVGIGTTTPALKLNVTGDNSYPASSGTAQTGMLRIAGTSNNVLDMGSAGVAPFGNWLQSTDKTALGTNYPLLLNPNGGNVGIGLATPIIKLEVVGDAGGSLIKAGAGGTRNITLAVGSNRVGMHMRNDGVSHAGITSDGSDIFFGTASSTINPDNWGTELMTIKSDGKVGIGTASPTEKLHVAQGNIILDNTFGLKLNRTGDTAPLTVADMSASNVIRMGDAGEAGWASTFSGYTVTLRAGGVDRIFVKETGQVGIGTTSPGYKLDVQGGGVNTSGVYTNVSDIRLKQDIHPLESSLNKILKLQGVSYHWKDQSFDSTKQVGFIAQEVEKVFPEVVKTDKKGFKAMSYSQLVSPIVEAVKELYGKVMANDKQLVLHSKDIASIKEQMKVVSRVPASIKQQNSEVIKLKREKDAEIAELKAENKSLKAYLCQKDRAASFCKSL